MTPEEKFCSEVLACIGDLNEMLPKLAMRYGDMAIVSAFVEVAAGSLRLFIQQGDCPPDQARRILTHAFEIAFPPPQLVTPPTPPER